MDKILYAFLTIVSLGAVLGIGLAIASRFFAVIKDKRIESVETALPGLNCGACGYAGCSSYAGAIINEGASLTLCSPGGPESAAALAKIMGVEVAYSNEKKVTQVRCRGGKETSRYVFSYQGIADCNALYILYEGDKECKYACLALGSCIKVCPVDAIDYDKEGLVWVDKDLCISCGKCIQVCPTRVMKWIPYSADYMVACNSTDKGGVVRKYCSVGCIGCKICEKKSPEGGYKVENFLADIDYSAKGERAEACTACPTKSIIPVVNAESPVKELKTQREFHQQSKLNQ
ncbi:MAG: RnfABCDGE type electron transport complex subunit B [Spirochaetota bacterium]